MANTAEEPAETLDIAPVFSTPVVSKDWPDVGPMNAALSEVILARAAEDPGVRRSNVGGWHSASDLMSWPEPPLAQFRERLLAAVPQLVTLALTEPARNVKYDLQIVAWANVLRDGGYHAAHEHPRAHWSGVYYVSDGAPAAGNPLNGRLELFDPRTGVGMVGPDGNAFSTPCLLETRPGRMLFFPSWLRHMVHPFHGAGARISISYNLTLRPTR